MPKHTQRKVTLKCWRFLELKIKIQPHFRVHHQGTPPMDECITTALPWDCHGGIATSIIHAQTKRIIARPFQDYVVPRNQYLNKGSTPRSHQKKLARMDADGCTDTLYMDISSSSVQTYN